MNDWQISGNLSAYTNHWQGKIATAVAAEREACAKIAENHSHDHEIQSIRNKQCGCAWCAAAARIAVEIRNRSVKP
jgi:hypothetical protein